MPSGRDSRPVCIEPIRMRFGSTAKPRSSGWKRRGYINQGRTTTYTRIVDDIGLEDEDRSDQNKRGAGEHGQRDRFAKKKSAPQHAEDRNEISDGERAGRTNVGDEPKVQKVGDRAADEAEGQHAAGDERRGHLSRRP